MSEPRRPAAPVAVADAVAVVDVPEVDGVVVVGLVDVGKGVLVVTVGVVRVGVVFVSVGVDVALVPEVVAGVDEPPPGVVPVKPVRAKEPEKLW